MANSLRERYEFSRSTKPLLLEFDEKRLKELKYVTTVAKKLSVIGGKTQGALSELSNAVSKYAGEGFGKKLLRKLWSDRAESAGFAVNGLINAYKVVEDYLDARQDLQEKFKSGKYKNFKEFMADTKTEEKSIFNAFKKKGKATPQSSGGGPGDKSIFGINPWKVLNLSPEDAWDDLINADFNNFKSIIGVATNANDQILTRPPSNIPGKERTSGSNADAQTSPENQKVAARIASNGISSPVDAYKYVLASSNIPMIKIKTIIRNNDRKQIDRAVNNQIKGVNAKQLSKVTDYLISINIIG